MPATPSRIGFITQPFRETTAGPLSAVVSLYGNAARKTPTALPTYFDDVADAEDMAQERLDLLGVQRSVITAAIDQIDAALGIDITEQTTLIELAQAMAAPCNAVAALALDSRLVMPRVALGAEQFVLDAQGRQMPPVLGMARQNSSPPYSEMKMGAARSWRVHTFDEIAFFAELIERGLYDAAATYREGNMVEKIDKSRWLYINATPSSGNAPPNWPTTTNAYWDNLSPPASEDPAVANSRVLIPGLLTSLPVEGEFDGQQVATSDTGEVYRWHQGGPGWVRVADITATAQREIVPQFSVVEIKQGEPGNSGDRIVLHTVRRGIASLGGGTWSIVSQTLGAGSASVGSSTGAVTLSRIVQSGRYTIRYTHTDGVATDLVVNVTYFPSAAANPAFDSSAIYNFNSGSFVAVTNELEVVLPSGVTSVSLAATNVDLQLFPEAPLPAAVTVEMKWQRETAPSTWSDVGSAATSSPNPSVSSPEGFVEANPGLITCDRNASGLTAGSTERFRLVARVSAGTVRAVIASGLATASA